MRVKVCGLSDPATIAAAARSGAAYIGFVFFEKSPRFVEIDHARNLALAVPEGIAKVALTVNFDDVALDRIMDSVPIDMIQLHGSETPERVAEVKSRYGLPVMKAIGVADPPDLDAIAPYAQVADQLLIDAKPPKTSELPGGNGLSFDWKLLQGRRWAVPWMLAGGLTPENVMEAANLTGARQVDVSSGIETEPGKKSIALIDAFLQAALGPEHSVQSLS